MGSILSAILRFDIVSDDDGVLVYVFVGESTQLFQGIPESVTIANKHIADLQSDNLSCSHRLQINCVPILLVDQINGDNGTYQLIIEYAIKNRV